MYESGLRQSNSVPLRSDALWSFSMEHAPLLERETGALVSRSGHRGTWSRSGSLAGLNHASGTYTAPQAMPGYDWRSVLGTSSLCLTLSINDLFTFPVGWPPQVLSGWLRFVENGAVSTNGATVWAVAPDDPTSGVRLYISSNGTGYGLTYHNGSTPVTAQLGSGPSSGQTVDLWWNWSGGGVTLWQTIDGASQITASSGALAIVASWSATTCMRFARRGATQNPGSLSLRAGAVWPGTLSYAQMSGGW